MLVCESLARAIDECVLGDVAYCIGPHGIVDPAADALSDVRSTLAWWRSNRPREYAELIVCFSAVVWSYGGMAARIGGPVGVASHGDWMQDELYRRTALHEVGHCLGMRHDHGRQWSNDGESVATPMAPMHPIHAKLRYSDQRRAPSVATRGSSDRGNATRER